MHRTERLRIFRTAALLAGGLLLLAHAAVAQSLTPSSLVDSYERAWGQHDVDAALALLADNAVITLDNPAARALTSHEQIRVFLQDAGLPRPPMLTTPRQVNATTVTWSERIESQLLGATEVTVHAVIEDGKIRSLEYRSGQLVRGTGIPASTSTPETAGAIFAALLLFGAGMLSLASVRSQVRSGSNLRGRLMADLQRWNANPSMSVRAPTSL